MSSARISGSFRDPSGFLFRHEGIVHRQVNAGYAPLYDQLMQSGLYAELSSRGLLIPHDEVDGGAVPSPAGAPPAHRVLRPEQLDFVSYPYEWSFSQWKAAARLTLQIQQAAIAKGMVLRDASAYNVQFHRGKPVFIDTLSFGPYTEGEPWVAYQQFCRHFLAPLALMARVDVGLGQLLRVHIDGIPLDLASRLLPGSTWLSFGLATHVHLHARSTRRYADSAAGGSATVARTGVSKTAMLGMIDALLGTVEGLSWEPAGTEWGDYYQHTNYTDDAHQAKRELVGRFLTHGGAAPKVVWDMGANTGMFSKVAADRGARVLSFDIDPAAVEHHWRAVVKRGETQITPLLQDLTNPSPGLGWAGDERDSLHARGPADAVLALALVHHIAISNNVPLDRIAAYFRRISPVLILEFVPKADSQVKRLLATREDIFPDYTEAGFERAVAGLFDVVAKERIPGSERTLYRLEAR